MRIPFIVILLTAASLIGGCAPKNNNHLASFAITDPGQAISIPHPVEQQKRNVAALTTWRGSMNAELFVEVISGNAVFPVIAYNGNKRYMGFAYLVERNYWGKWIVQYEFEASLAELKNAKFLLVNRDGSYACYDLTGNKVGSFEAEKFDEDLAFQQKYIEERGSTLSDLDGYWRQYFVGKIFKGRMVDPSVIDSFVTEYVVGSEEWVAMVEGVNRQIESGKLTAYKVGDVVRIARMDFDQFTDKASDVHDFTTGNRIIKRTVLPVISLASMAMGPLAMAGAGFGGTVYSANINNDWHGHTMKSKLWGHELAPTFVDICKSYERLIAERDEEIKQYLNLGQHQLSQR